MLYGPSALLAFKLEMTSSTSIVVTGDTKKLLHREVVKNSTNDLFPGCIAVANVGRIEEKYLLNFFFYCCKYTYYKYKKKLI